MEDFDPSNQMFPCPAIIALIGNPPPPDSLPHLALLEKIERDEGPVSRDEMPLLLLFKDILDSSWGLDTKPLATYALGSSRLILCEDGIWELNDARDHIRYLGHDNIWEPTGWLMAECEDSGEE
ncbi:hypothetical protein BJ508DRAFT_335273 [Ascobolus immersus RN42]|uniref:Uncharacterized protein n=1 Tax=Ascobolus immersus RN42 TaxID=1160509 RepID=A0A3N4HGH8_ASCIM|nr:hypothetical protein BJ508DRAFT_335273 [Ascobolus immersus RN42]